MARPKKPIALHKLQGTARNHRLENRIEELALPPGPMGAAPAWFGDIAAEEWVALTTHPQYSQVLNPVHRGTLIEYCILFELMIQAAQGIKDITASQRQTLNSLRMQLGITPASQSKVRMPDKKPIESKWADTKPIPISKPA